MLIMIIPKTQIWWSSSNVPLHKPTGQEKPCALLKQCHINYIQRWWSIKTLICFRLSSIVVLHYAIAFPTVHSLTGTRCPCWSHLPKPWLYPVKFLWGQIVEAYSLCSTWWGMTMDRYALWNIIVALTRKRNRRRSDSCPDYESLLEKHFNIPVFATRETCLCCFSLCYFVHVV